VQSPNLSFLGTPTLSRLSNSFLNSSFRGKTPEVISNLVKPLLHPTTSDEQEQQRQQQHEDTRKSSQYLLPSSRKPSLDQIPEDRKPVVIGHEVSPYQKCSYTQGVMNVSTKQHRFIIFEITWTEMAQCYWFKQSMLVNKATIRSNCLRHHCMHTCLAVLNSCCLSTEFTVTGRALNH
jgi:hypothetical protein